MVIILIDKLSNEDLEKIYGIYAQPKLVLKGISFLIKKNKIYLD